MLVIIAAICMFLFMSTIWLIAVKLDNYSIVDIIWGITFIITTTVVLVYTGLYNVVSLTIAALVLYGDYVYLFTCFREMLENQKIIATRTCVKSGGIK